MADDGDTSAPDPRSDPAPPVPTATRQLLLAVELTPSVEAAAQARDLVGDLLRRGGRPELCDTACLLTSELVANAVLHAGAPVELVVDLDASRLAVEVIDPSTVTPRPIRATAGDTCGRGLAMVERLADAWGVSRIVVGSDPDDTVAPRPTRRPPDDAPGDDPGAKSVWFSLSA